MFCLFDKEIYKIVQDVVQIDLICLILQLKCNSITIYCFGTIIDDLHK